VSKLWKSTFIAIAICAVLAGCGGTGDSKSSEPQQSVKEPVVAAQPVTIKFAARSNHVSTEEVSMYIIDPVKKKYPNITVEFVDYDKKGFSLDQLVAAGDIPDIHMQYIGNLMPFVAVGLDYNIEELIKQQKFDTSRISPEFLQTMKSFLSKDYLIGLPFDNNAFGLFYNRNLFDKFGVAYPKDGMTWEEARTLAVKLSRNAEGVQYYGLDPEYIFRGARQLALPYIDMKTDKAVFETQDWKDLFELWLSMYKIPGGEIPKTLSVPKAFYDGNIAMFGGYSNQIKDMNKSPNLQWDVVTYPTNPKAPGVASSVDSLAASITSSSKHKTEAFQVLSVMLSDEVQANLSSHARMSVLKDRAIQEQFGKANPDLQSKNVVALTKLKMAPLQPVKFAFKNDPGTITIHNAFKSVAFDGKDINTALREANETLNKEIQEIKSR
jgi:multiple sugar transport system substrate-binding protein